MVHKKIRVLIADDDIDFCFVCKEQINLFSDVVCCGVAHDGRETLQKIVDLQPDVVLLDDIMPVMDGLSVLEQMKIEPPPKTPHVIANSASGQDTIAHALLNSGAKYFLEKPFETETLLRRIRNACAQDSELYAQQPEKQKQSLPLFCAEEKPQQTVISPEKIVLQMVILLGVPTKLIGHDYIQEALCILIRNNAARPTLKQIYEMIAERHDSDGRCVENAISSAIKAALANKTPAMTELLSMLPGSHAQTISNGKFLTLAAQRIRFTSL